MKLEEVKRAANRCLTAPSPVTPNNLIHLFDIFYDIVAAGYAAITIFFMFEFGLLDYHNDALALNASLGQALHTHCTLVSNHLYIFQLIVSYATFYLCGLSAKLASAVFSHESKFLSMVST